MNDRQKLAALLFRIGGAALVARVLAGLVVLFIVPGIGPVTRLYTPGYLMYSGIAYLALGFALLFAAIPLGKLFGRGLD